MAAEQDTYQVVCCRIVHGGTEREPVVIKHGTESEKESLARMDAVSSFAPLHNHHAMLVVRSCLDHLPSAVSVLCFDTLFHSSIPDFRTRYAVSTPPHKTPVPLVKYGFHGLSYKSVVSQIANKLGKAESETNLVVAHLGSGGSVCWIKDGKSANTSMGLTPLEGLPGGTRSGSVDPSLIFHHTPDCSETTDWAGREITKAEMVLNKESGFKALVGTDNFGTITANAFPENSKEGDKDSLLVYKLYLDHIMQFVSFYVSSALAVGPLDGVVLAGGIGEKSARLRADVLGELAWVEKLGGGGGGLDVEANEEGKGLRRITKEGSKVPGWVVETDEELVVIEMAWEATGNDK